MANYSYTAGMEARGLTWLVVPIAAVTSSLGTSPNLAQISKQINGGALSTTTAFDTDVLILENYIVADGRGAYYNFLFVYDMNSPKRLPGDGIRFHNGGSFIAAKPL